MARRIFKFSKIRHWFGKEYFNVLVVKIVYIDSTIAFNIGIDIDSKRVGTYFRIRHDRRNQPLFPTSNSYGNDGGIASVVALEKDE